MTKCPNCGADVRDGIKFCESCGTRIEENNAPRNSFCPQCGTEIPAGAAFCPKCGFRVGTQPAGGYPYPQQQPMYNGPQQHPQQPKVDNLPLKGGLGLIRCLLSNIIVLAVLAMMAATLFMPYTDGDTNTWVSSIQTVIDSVNGVTGYAMIPLIIHLVIFFLPPIGIVAFGIPVLVTSIMGLIQRKLPSYNYGIYMIGFVLSFPLYQYGVVASLAPAEGMMGFEFLMFNSKCPVFMMSLAALGVYIAGGIVESFLRAIYEKRSLAAPIMKIFAVAMGGAMLFLMGGYISALIGSGETNTVDPYLFYLAGAEFVSLGDGTDPRNLLGLVGMIYPVMHVMATIFIGNAIGDNFKVGAKKNNRVNAVVFVIIACIYGNLWELVMMAGGSGGNFVPVIPSICGFVIIGLGIVQIIFGDIIRKLELPKQPQPQYQQPMY